MKTPGLDNFKTVTKMEIKRVGVLGSRNVDVTENATNFMDSKEIKRKSYNLYKRLTQQDHSFYRMNT